MKIYENSSVSIITDYNGINVLSKSYEKIILFIISSLYIFQVIKINYIKWFLQEGFQKSDDITINNERAGINSSRRSQMVISK